MSTKEMVPVIRRKLSVLLLAGSVMLFPSVARGASVGPVKVSRNGADRGSGSSVSVLRTSIDGTVRVTVTARDLKNDGDSIYAKSGTLVNTHRCQGPVYETRCDTTWRDGARLSSGETQSRRSATANLFVPADANSMKIKVWVCIQLGWPIADKCSNPAFSSPLAV